MTENRCHRANVCLSEIKTAGAPVSCLYDSEKKFIEFH
jgi:hypothetical protein